MALDFGKGSTTGDGKIHLVKQHLSCCPKLTTTMGMSEEIMCHTSSYLISVLACPRELVDNQQGHAWRLPVPEEQLSDLRA